MSIEGPKGSKRATLLIFLKVRKIRKEYGWSKEMIPINENECLRVSEASGVNKNLRSKRKRHAEV